MADGARLRGASATAQISSIILALLAGSYLIHSWRAAAPLADPADTFFGLVGLLFPGLTRLWRRARPLPPRTPPSRQQWLTSLARAECDRLHEDLRDRGVEVACIAVPWTSAPEFSGVTETTLHRPPATGRVDRLRQQVWSGRRPARVVVCGPAGSGKSVALHLLAKQLLDEALGRQEIEGPVPVVLSPAGWDARRPLYPWLAERLSDRHPDVVGPESGVEGQDLTRALLRDGAVVPFLDGLDELAAHKRARLLQALNQALGAGLAVAMSSREEQLREAVAEAGAVRGSVAVRLDSLGPQHLAAFLDDSQVPNRLAWEPLLDAMRAGTAPSAEEVFTTPFMQWLGSTVYGSGSAAPTELADMTRFPTAEHLRQHLLASLVPSVFGPLANGFPTRRRWTARRALRLLRFLAQEGDVHGIRWWTLYRRTQGQLALVYGLTLTGLTVSLSTWSQAAGTAVPIGAVWGTVCGAAFTLAYVVTRAEEYRIRSAVPGGFRPDVNGRTVLSRLVRLLPVLIAAGAATEIVTGLRFDGLRWPDLWALFGQGAALSGIAGLCGGFAAGTLLDRVHTLDESLAPAHATRPLELLRRDSKATAGMACGLAVAAALVTWVSWRLNLDRTPPAAFLLVATATAAAIGPGLFVAWPIFRAAHAWFAVRDRLPLHFGDFMNTARAVGVLREEGMAYHFRHALLRSALRARSGGPTG
jgi:DNA polymerase III delta prime subunit